MSKNENISNKEEIIISTDTLRTNRIPPGQIETKRWPVLHAGPVPKFDKDTWRFSLFGLVEEEWSCNFDEFLKLPRIKVKGDFHCVTTWSLLNNYWEGVSVHEVVKHIKLKSEVKFVLAHAEYGWTTNMPLNDFLGEDCLFALKRNEEDLTPEHGYPVRLVIPRLYAWKSAKWIRGIEFLAEDKAGFWENGGYHMRGDPWTEQRYNWS